MVIGVLMGGPSEEREVSIKSGRAVAEALRKAGLRVEEILLAGRDLRELDGRRIDIAFIAMHGEFGEDGTLARLLEERGIPYTGSDPDASRLAMDKIAAKRAFEAFGIPTPPYIVVNGTLDPWEADWFVHTELDGYPVVVKPASNGSSIGISIVDTRDGLRHAIGAALAHDRRVLIERYIAGRELTCGVIENRPLPLVEMRPSRRFFDYRAKYQDQGTIYSVAPRMDPRLYRLCQEAALCAHIAVGARDFSRVDLILSGRKPFILEVNTIPGLTERSLLPKAAASVGMDFVSLCKRMVEMAAKRSKRLERTA